MNVNKFIYFKIAKLLCDGKKVYKRNSAANIIPHTPNARFVFCIITTMNSIIYTGTNCARTFIRTYTNRNCISLIGNTKFWNISIDCTFLNKSDTPPYIEKEVTNRAKYITKQSIVVLIASIPHRFTARLNLPFGVAYTMLQKPRFRSSTKARTTIIFSTSIM